MNRQAQGVVMLVVGGAVLRASLTDLYLRYVRAGLRPFLLAAGVVLIIAGIATLWYEWRAARAAKAKQPEQDGHGRAHREPRIAWLLILPVLALIVVAPPALGSYAADQTGTALLRPPGFAPLPAGDPLQMSVVDYAGRAAYDSAHSLDGRRVEITGFISLGRGGPYLIRMILSCCAADALPIKVGLAGQVPAALRSNAWFQITGSYTNKQIKDFVNGGIIPYIDVSQAKPIRAPRDQYER